MPPGAFTDDDDEHYASSEDSDFAPDAAPEAGSDHSDSDDADEQPAAKRRRKDGDAVAEDAGYDNSGDEAIIEKGHKRRRRRREKGGEADEDEGGEGGLIKTRRQRAAEKEERKYAVSTGPVTIDVDAVWAQMLAGQPSPSKEPDNEPADGDEPNEEDSDAKAIDGVDQTTQRPPSRDEPSAMVRIKRTYNFAGQVHTEEKLVARDSAEAKLYFASQGEDAAAAAADASPTKRATRKAFRSAFEPATDLAPQRADLNLGMAARMRAGREAAQAKKLNTVEKSRMDWAGYVDQEGIKDELELAGRSKQSYTAREDFLARSEAKREEDARQARMAGRA